MSRKKRQCQGVKVTSFFSGSTHSHRWIYTTHRTNNSPSSTCSLWVTTMMFSCRDTRSRTTMVQDQLLLSTCMAACLQHKRLELVIVAQSKCCGVFFQTLTDTLGNVCLATQPSIECRMTRYMW